MAVFEDASQEFLSEAKAIGAERGSQYADTWAIDNQHPGFTAAMRKLSNGDEGREADRLIRAAGLVDTKISRIINGGPYKRDSYVDLINYLAALAKFHEQYDAKPQREARCVGGPPGHSCSWRSVCCVGDGCENTTLVCTPRPDFRFRCYKHIELGNTNGAVSRCVA